jgi:hypothetical protein
VDLFGDVRVWAVAMLVAIVAAAFAISRVGNGDDASPLVAYGADPEATPVVEDVSFNTTYRRVTEVFIRIPESAPTQFRSSLGPEVQVHELRGRYGLTGCLTSMVAETRTREGDLIEKMIRGPSGALRIDADGASMEMDADFDISKECVDDLVATYERRFPEIAEHPGAVVEWDDDRVRVTQHEDPELARFYAPELDVVAVDLIYDFRADTLEHIGHRMVATLFDGTTVLRQEERLLIAEVLHH